MVDWTVALNTATKLVKPGPEISREGASAVVAELRSFADRAEAYVREVTGMEADSGTAPVLVVDRPRWIQANLDGFRQILGPLNAKMIERMKQSNPTVAAIGPRITGVEVGALLNYLSSKVLGQFDPFFPGADSTRLAVACSSLHQASSPSNASSMSSPLTSGSGSACMRKPIEDAVCGGSVAAGLSQRSDRPDRRLGRARPGDRGADAEGRTPARHAEAVTQNQEVSIIDLVQTPAQRETVDRVTAVMSLLEGHADVVMDGVGPVIPTVETIRAKFTVRRQGRGLTRSSASCWAGRQDASISRRRHFLPHGDG